MPAPTPAPASEGTEACQCHNVTHRGCAGRVSPTAGSHSTWALAPGHFPLPRPGHLASYKRKSRFENLLSDSGNIEAFVWWTPAMLWRSGLLVLLAINKEGLDQIPKWQSRPAGEQPSADIFSGQPHSKLRSPPKKQQDKPLVGSFTLTTGICSRLISRHKACCIDRTASLVCQSAACQGIVSRRVPEGSRLTPPTGCGVSP